MEGSELNQKAGAENEVRKERKNILMHKVAVFTFKIFSSGALFGDKFMNIIISDGFNVENSLDFCTLSEMVHYI